MRLNLKKKLNNVYNSKGDLSSYRVYVQNLQKTMCAIHIHGGSSIYKLISMPTDKIYMVAKGVYWIISVVQLPLPKLLRVPPGARNKKFLSCAPKKTHTYTQR
jgi:hypothetical protein